MILSLDDDYDDDDPRVVARPTIAPRVAVIVIIIARRTARVAIPHATPHDAARLHDARAPRTARLSRSSAASVVARVVDSGVDSGDSVKPKHTRVSFFGDA